MEATVVGAAASAKAPTVNADTPTMTQSRSAVSVAVADAHQRVFWTVGRDPPWPLKRLAMP